MVDQRFVLDVIHYPFCLSLYARLYSCTRRSPRMVHVASRIALGKMLRVLAENVLGDGLIQPYIHTVEVEYTRRNGSVEYYTIFCKRHSRLPANRCIRVHFRGDILIASKDATDLYYEDMSYQARRNADDIIRRFARDMFGRRAVPRRVKYNSRW